jgi:hypothetical protein
MEANKELLTIDTGPYSKDGPFDDPVVRCEGCKGIVKLEVLHNKGACVCGNRRVRNLTTLTEDEMEKCKKWKIDPVFLSLFAPVDEETGEPL